MKKRKFKKRKVACWRTPKIDLLKVAQAAEVTLQWARTLLIS
jgi:hypothetical protein